MYVPVCMCVRGRERERETSNVFFDGSPETERDDVAPFRLLGCGPDGLGGELGDRFGD